MTQSALAFDAPMSIYAGHRADVAREAVRQENSKARILARLRQGPATNVELARICLRYTGRCSDLRIYDGYRIEKEHVEGGVWRYILVGEPDAVS